MKCHSYEKCSIIETRKRWMTFYGLDLGTDLLQFQLPSLNYLDKVNEFSLN